MLDVIIIGSGPAGVAAAMSLKDKPNVLMIDVGNEKPSSPIYDQNFYDPQFRLNNHRQILGDNFEYLSHLKGPNPMVKLRSPSYRYITERSCAQLGDTFDGFEPVISYAKGGLSNAWGGQLYEYFDSDLKGYPIRYEDLSPYYKRLYQEIPIAGEHDDLTLFYGQNDALKPPHMLSQLGSRCLRRYNRSKRYLNKHGITIGRPRLAMSTDDQGHSYNNLEFIQSGQKTLYTPSQTLQKLISEGLLQYKPGFYVERYEEFEGGVSVFVRSITNGEQTVFKARKILLAAGAINSASIVLRSNRDTTTELPILDNPLSYIPFIDPFSLGLPTQQRSYYNQLNLMYQGLNADDPIMGTFYALTGIYNTELLAGLPLDFRSSLIAGKYLFPAMMVLHLWYPNRSARLSNLGLNSDLSVNIRHSPYKLGYVENILIQRLRRIGLLSHSSLCQFPLPGNSIHYAGTLPMRSKPNTPYECHANGRLNGSRSIFVIDGASLPSLAAKNHSLTIMANAMRIADSISNRGVNYDK